MRYQCQVAIHASLQKVTELFMDENKMSQWQKGWIKREVITGVAKQSGCVSHLHFTAGDRQMVMKETIESCDMPHSQVAIYELGGTWNRCINKFYEKDDQVIWEMDSEFRFKEDLQIPEEHFISQTQNEMEQFKQFVESQK